MRTTTVDVCAVPADWRLPCGQVVEINGVLYETVTACTMRALLGPAGPWLVRPVAESNTEQS